MSVSCKFAAYFQNNFSQEDLQTVALSRVPSCRLFYSSDQLCISENHWETTFNVALQVHLLVAIFISAHLWFLLFPLESSHFANFPDALKYIIFHVPRVTVDTDDNNLNGLQSVLSMFSSMVILLLVRMVSKFISCLTHFMQLVSFYTPRGFLCFQGVQKETSGVKCVNQYVPISLLF